MVYEPVITLNCVVITNFYCRWKEVSLRPLASIHSPKHLRYCTDATHALIN